MAQSDGCATLDALYGDHHQWLFGRLHRRLGCEDDAADLTHDTYLRIITSGRLPTPAQSRAFLLQVAKGLTVDLYRRRALERAYLDALATLPPVHAPSTEERQLVLETLIDIDRALDALPKRVRETFMLARFEGLTYSAIAERLQVSVGSVRKYMLKAATACLLSLDTATSEVPTS